MVVNIGLLMVGKKERNPNQTPSFMKLASRGLHKNRSMNMKNDAFECFSSIKRI